MSIAVRAPAASLVVAALLGTSCSGSSPPPPSYAAAIQEGQEAAYEVLRQGSATSLGIALVTRDRLVWAESFGVVDASTGARPTSTTRYGIGSVSKMFAAVAVLQLVERGLLRLDEPVATYLDFHMAVPEASRITVRMLLDHASGIPGTTFRNGFTTSLVPDYEAQAMAALADQRLKDEPGHMSVYCNDGFTVVEALVRAVTGKSYSQYVKDAILDPLGMAQSAFPLGPFPDGSFARFHMSGVPQAQEYTNLHASGGLYSTPTDMAAFARLFLDGGSVGGTRILSAASVAAMAVDGTAGSFNPVPSATMAYGLGWDSVTEPALRAVGVDGWTKNGGSYFYGAQILVAPADGLAVVVMGTNGNGYSPLAVAQRVMLRALAETGRIPAFPAPLAPVAAPEAPAPDGLIASMAGMYGSHDKIVQVRAEGDGSLTLLTLGAEGFAPTTVGLRYRQDGWFTATSSPLESYRLVEGEGRAYLARRSPMDLRTYLDQMALLQRVEGTGLALSDAWKARLGRSWLVVNEHPDSQLLLMGANPAFQVGAVPELPGLVVVAPSLVTAPMVLDPTGSDDQARMMLVIPGGASRDLNDLDVVVRGGDEWLRWGAFLHRPVDGLPVLTAGTTTSVAIGPEGHAEWRAVSDEAPGATVSVTGARAWRLYDATFDLLASGASTGETALPAGAGPGYLMIQGAPGDAVGVAVAAGP